MSERSPPVTRLMIFQTSSGPENVVRSPFASENFSKLWNRLWSA
jgi:hypothetical protein